MSPQIRLDGTQLLVFGGVLLIVGAGTWQFIGAFLVWAIWQVVLYYVLLVLVAAALYGALYVVVDREKAESPTVRDPDRLDETPTE